MFVINGENLKKKRTAKIALSSVFHNPSSQLNNLIYLHSFLFQLLLFFIGVAHFFCFPSAATTTTTIITTTLLFFPQRPSLYCHCFPSITTTILPLFSSTTTTFITATFPLFSHHHHRHFSIVFLPDRLFRWPMRPFFFSRFYCFFLLLRHHHHHHHIFIVVLPDGLKPDQEGQTRAKISKIR